jgi:riboflavin biosynthesis pyrimidine reductase
MDSSQIKGSIDQLYPERRSGLDLAGLYLAQDLRSETRSKPGPFIYANFISSLDGRIALSQNGSGETGAPKQTINRRDWRLFQELAIQSDLVISSGRYLRDYASGDAQDIVRVYDDPAFTDLKEWRELRGLNPYPDLAIVSRSLSFDLPADMLEGSRSLVVVTTESSDARRKQELEAQSIRVLECGQQDVEGQEMARRLDGLGYNLMYSAAGPRVAHMLLAGGVLNRLYLTFALHVLGGADFASIVEGPRFDPPFDLRLRSLYFDRDAPGPTGQLFAAFDCG